MKYPRVNLLKRAEQRYQGAVSHRFMLVILAVAPILFIALFSGIKLIQSAGVESDLSSSQEIWKNLEPRLLLHQDEQRAWGIARQSMVLVDGWTGSQVSFFAMLSEIQGEVPQNIQLTRLAIRSESQTSVFAKAADFSLDYKLVIQGLSEGERAEDSVFGFHKDLMATELVGSTFDSVKLASMRKQGGKDGQSMRGFTLEGFASEGGGQ